LTGLGLRGKQTEDNRRGNKDKKLTKKYKRKKERQTQKQNKQELTGSSGKN
jgi:hypothetical protein